MALIPLKVPPGVSRNSTQYQTGGRWFDANLVRWKDGVMLPVGGWRKYFLGDALFGKCRGLFAWKDNLSKRYLALGTSKKLYLWNESGTLYDITPSGFIPGRDDAVYGAGFGAGDFGTQVYGTARTGLGKVLDASCWTLDSWGEWLVGCAPHDGKLYSWQLDTTLDATQISNSPTDCRGLIVTPERHLVALGAGGNPRKVAWSSQEDFTSWTPTATNTAGDLELQTTGSIKFARKVRGQILIVTETDAHVMNYLGTPFVYGIERVGSFCGAASANSVAAVDAFAVWMGQDGFHVFDGVVRPLECEVRDYVFGDINKIQISKAYAGVNAEFNEVWWFYPSANSVENDRYVVWNWRENHWTIGELERTAWLATGVFNAPIAVSNDGFIYEHETGWTADGASLADTRFVESGAVEIGAGDQIVFARQLIPDERTQGQARVKFKSQFTPNGLEQTFGPYTLENYTDVRFSGRQVALRVEGVADASWRVGTLRLDAVPGGQR